MVTLSMKLCILLVVVNTEGQLVCAEMSCLRNSGRRPRNVTSCRNRGPSPLLSTQRTTHEPHAETNTPSIQISRKTDVESVVRSVEALATAGAWNVTVGNDREGEPVVRQQIAAGVIKLHRLHDGLRLVAAVIHENEAEHRSHDAFPNGQSGTVVLRCGDDLDLIPDSAALCVLICFAQRHRQRRRAVVRGCACSFRLSHSRFAISWRAGCLQNCVT